MIKVIHTDDDEKFIAYFKKILQGIPEILYEACFPDAEETYTYLQHHQDIDILFLDIDMPGKNGLWLADRAKDSLTEVIFVTAHPGYITSAFEVSAIDYMTKPVDRATVEAVIERYKQRNQKNMKITWEKIQEFYKTYITKELPPKRIFVNSMGETNILPLREIMYFNSKENYTEIVMADGAKYVSSKNLKVYGDILAENDDFVKIHRSSIINKNYTSKIIKDSKRHRINVIMQNGKELEISYLKKDTILEALMQ